MKSDWSNRESVEMGDQLPESSLTDTLRGVAGVITRRRWWIFGSAFIIPLVVIAVVFQLPNQYTSEATLLVVQQQVSVKYVDPTNTASPSEVLKTIVREVLSRPRLLGVIDAFGLYSQDKKQLGPDRLAERMRNDITVTPLDQLPGRNDFSAFMISFKADSPRLAQEVASRLTSLFIEENLRKQGSQAATTMKFLTEQLETAKKRLEEQEKRLRDFKVRNLGELPEQEQANLGTITDLRIQLQNNMSNASRAQQQRISLESVLSGNIARLQNDRSELLKMLTPKHPEVVQRDQQIARHQVMIDRLNTGSPVVETLESSSIGDDPVIAQLKGQVEANIADRENLAREEKRLRAEVGQYQGRLRLTPVREQQLAEIMRDYELSRKDYADLLDRQLRSQLTSNMEEQQAGQHFRLVDPPTLPIEPSSPKRLRISLGGIGAGLALGLVLAFMADHRSQAFHTEKEVQLHFNPPMLVAFPLVRTRAEERRRRWVLGGEVIAGCAMLAIVLAAEFYVYQQSR